MFRIGQTGSVFGPGQPAELAPDEQVLYSEHVMEEGSNRTGLLAVTDRRVFYKPGHAGSRYLDLPIRSLSVLDVVKPPFGSLRILRVGHGRYASGYWVAHADEWVQWIRRVQEMPGQGAVAPMAPAPPLGPAAVGPLQAGMPGCPVCGTPFVLRPDGTMVCPKCGPPATPPQTSFGAGAGGAGPP